MPDEPFLDGADIYHATALWAQELLHCTMKTALAASLP